MIAPVVNNSFKESLRVGAEIFHTLKKILTSKGLSTGVGDEGGFAPKLKSNREALELVNEAISKAGYTPGKDVFLALADVAATELFEGGKYRWEGAQITGQQLGDVYRGWAKDFALVSIEDGFSEDDWESWKAFTKTEGSRMQIVGDDLFVTNPKRVARGIEEQAANISIFFYQNRAMSRRLAVANKWQGFVGQSPVKIEKPELNSTCPHHFHQ